MFLFFRFVGRRGWKETTFKTLKRNQIKNIWKRRNYIVISTQGQNGFLYQNKYRWNFYVPFLILLPKLDFLTAILHIWNMSCGVILRDWIGTSKKVKSTGPIFLGDKVWKIARLCIKSASLVSNSASCKKKQILFFFSLASHAKNMISIPKKVGGVER